MSLRRRTTLPKGRILLGDVRTQIEHLPSASVDCVVTSPPYFKLRNYQHHDQIGLENAVNGWVDELLGVARGIARVIKPTGTLWLNLGDTYAASTKDGAPPKSLLLGPERLAQALIADGWVLRNKIIWSKPNPMPTSVRDRLSNTWEVIYCFARTTNYFYDLDAIRVPHRSSPRLSGTKVGAARPAWSVPTEWRAPLAGSNSGLGRYKALGLPGHPLGKNPGDVWVIPTAGYRGSHHAVYPAALAERAIKAGCPEAVCADCGTPWTRQRHTIVNGQPILGLLTKRCDCDTSNTRPGVVLDSFMGSGTTAIAAERLGRDWVGIELNPQFLRLATARIADARRTIARASAA